MISITDLPALRRAGLTAPPSCTALLTRAAQDNTQLYFALLPSELRSAVDLLLRAPEWPRTGVLTPMKLSDDLASSSETVWGRVEWALAAEGEPV